ncbi:uncharacterized protein [Hetaerina americana]|uniref:uncharacterized protein n=1 Tax=Hetaerina americana TaxID=62018 RepID=UPI003A7F30CE
MPVPTTSNQSREPIAEDTAPKEPDPAPPPASEQCERDSQTGEISRSPNVRVCYLRPKTAEDESGQASGHTNGGSENGLAEMVPKQGGTSGSYGMSISRSAWDPYPWVCGIAPGGAADGAGLRRGDCLLKVGALSLLGLPVSEVAGALRADGGAEGLRLEVWNAEGGGEEEDAAAEGATGGRRRSGLRGPLPSALQRLSSCLSTIVAALECPVCLECPLPPPAQQCPNGHLLCLRCRLRSCRCPICRINLAPMASTAHGHPLPPNVGRGRCLLADEIHSILDSELGIGDSGGIRATKRPPPVPSTRPECQRRQNTAISTANRLLARIGLGGKAVSMGDLPRSTGGGSDEPNNSRHPTSPLTSRILGRLTNGKSHSLDNLQGAPVPNQNLSPSCENLPNEPPSSPMTDRLLSKIVMGKACSLENLADNILVITPSNSSEAIMKENGVHGSHLAERLITRLSGKSFSLENISRSSGPQHEDGDDDTVNLIAVPRTLDREAIGIGL